MPKGGTKCPDCGYRFKAKRYRADGSMTTDLIRSMCKYTDAPDGQVTAWLCPGTSKKRRHTPQIVLIRRVNAENASVLVDMKIITAQAKELLDEFNDQWFEENKRKYRPDLIFR